MAEPALEGAAVVLVPRAPAAAVRIGFPRSPDDVVEVVPSIAPRALVLVGGATLASCSAPRGSSNVTVFLAGALAVLALAAAAAPRVRGARVTTVFLRADANGAAGSLVSSWASLATLRARVVLDVREGSPSIDGSEVATAFLRFRVAAVLDVALVVFLVCSSSSSGSVSGSCRMTATFLGLPLERPVAVALVLDVIDNSGS